MFEDAKQVIANSSEESSVYIGCDSIRYNKNNIWYAKYSTVIILHKDSKHGCQVFHHSEDMRDYGNLKQRLLTEVQFAVAAATEVIEVLGNRHLSDFHWIPALLDSGTGALGIRTTISIAISWFTLHNGNSGKCSTIRL